MTDKRDDATGVLDLPDFDCLVSAAAREIIADGLICVLLNRGCTRSFLRLFLLALGSVFIVVMGFLSALTLRF